MGITWIESDQVAMGPSIFSDKDLIILKEEGIKAIINLEEKIRENIDFSEFMYHHLPIPDFSVPSATVITEFLQIVTKFITDSIPVYIHCTAGCGRSGTMVAIWLTQSRSWSNAEELVNHLRSLRPCAIETDDQMKLVTSYIE